MDLNQDWFSQIDREQLLRVFGNDEERVAVAQMLGGVISQSAQHHYHPIAVCEVLSYFTVLLIAECLKETDKGLSEGHTTRDLLVQMTAGMLKTFDEVKAQEAH
ncbi:hypothetical protein LCGC14_0723240 [marine sediment metagenome]|uniref:Uncharacterized protein n=1 Tax=marine sediment metagenome TaxID=412755 RepID=A0A0F9TJ29_9ZZZZ